MFDEVVGKVSELAPPQEVLFHYTTWQGAKGILSSRRFWATAHHCTNDDAELQSADRIIVEVAKELRGAARGAATEILDLFIARYPTLKVTRLITVCLACFSTSRDDLAQWREYGDDGNGVCLGIRVLNEPGPPNQPSALAKVDYVESSWRASVKENFHLLCSKLADFEFSHNNLELGVAALNRVAAFISIQAKQERWAPEKEIRHVTLVPRGSGIQLMERESRGKKIEYLPVLVRAGEKRIALSEIIIGPNLVPDVAIQQMKSLLEEIGYKTGDYECPKIAISAIPPWNQSDLLLSHP